MPWVIRALHQPATGGRGAVAVHTRSAPEGAITLSSRAGLPGVAPGAGGAGMALCLCQVQKAYFIDGKSGWLRGNPYMYGSEVPLAARFWWA